MCDIKGGSIADRGEWTLTMTDGLGPVVLRHGLMECVAAPRVGGSIARLTLWHDGAPLHLLRPTPGAALDGGSAADMACFPLVPFSNRIASGHFRFEGADVALPLNHPVCPHPLHGHGWEQPWSIERQDDSAVHLSYRHAADAWPWSYRAEQRLTVHADGLEVRLDLTNESGRAMPAGFGLHPYLPKPPGTTLTAAVGSVWLGDATLLPCERTPVPRAWNFPDGRAMDDVVVDNGFPGWDGRATVDWPHIGRRLVVEADAVFGHLVVYAPQGEDYLCVEPVSHMTDAVNHADEADSGLRVLPPGGRLSGTVRLRLETLC